MERETNYSMRYSEGLDMPGVTSGQGPIRALVSFTLQTPVCQPQGGGGGALGYLGGRIRSLSKSKNTPKALISGQKSTLILIKMLTFSIK